MFDKLLAAVMSRLGITSFEKKDGKYALTEEQRKTLVKMYNEDFVNKCEKDLSGMSDDHGLGNALDYKNKLESLQAEYDAFKRNAEEKERNLTELVDTLSEYPEQDKKMEKTQASDRGNFKLNMDFLHNKVLENFVNGDGLMVNAADTIVTDELREEFGKYVANVKYDIITLLFGKLQATQYMTTKMTEKTVWRAIQSHISDLMQKFTPYWTPSGQSKFTPIEIPNHKHKINVPIKPAEIMEDVIGYLYDEGLQPKDMPIVKYIIEVLLKPKIEEERDEQIAVGVYDENKNSGKKDGDAGDVFGSIDGYITVLKRIHADESLNMIRLLKDVVLTRENIYDKVDEIYREIPKKYRTKSLPIFIDPDLLNLYELARDDKFPTSKNEDEKKKRLQHTNFTFIPLDGMVGTGCFFITPKENFIHLLSKNKGATKIWLQGENYDVKIFAEWWEAVGFAIAELLFGYVPPVESGSDSETGSGSGSEEGQTV